MSVPSALETYVIEKLLADTEVSALVGTKVHVSMAPTNTSPPYIILSRRSGGKEFGIDEEANQFLQEALRYNIKVVTFVPDGGYVQGDAIFEKIQQSLLGNEVPIEVNSGSYFLDFPRMEDDIRFMSSDNEKEYCHVGGVFLIYVYPSEG